MMTARHVPITCSSSGSEATGLPLPKDIAAADLRLAFENDR
jgi:hypothetical protein